MTRREWPRIADKGRRTFPEGGICQSHPNPEWWVTDGRTDESHAAKMMCDTCPVLAQCRDYAAAFTWAGVTIAGWAAPRNAVFPKWRQ